MWLHCKWSLVIGYFADACLSRQSGASGMWTVSQRVSGVDLLSASTNSVRSELKNSSFSRWLAKFNTENCRVTNVNIASCSRPQASGGREASDLEARCQKTPGLRPIISTLNWYSINLSLFFTLDYISCVVLSPLARTREAFPKYLKVIQCKTSRQSNAPYQTPQFTALHFNALHLLANLAHRLLRWLQRRDTESNRSPQVSGAVIMMHASPSAGMAKHSTSRSHRQSSSTLPTWQRSTWHTLKSSSQVRRSSATYMIPTSTNGPWPHLCLSWSSSHLLRNVI